MGQQINNRWLLPEGIDEALPESASWLEAARRELIDLYRSWGYTLVIPPFVEFMDSLLTGLGRDLDLQTFKLTDQLSGRMMGVRADMTPQVARIDARRMQNDAISRYCYLGTVLKTRPEGFSGSRSPLQVGAELYGHGGVSSEIEILRLMLDTMRVCGVSGLHLSLGHVRIFKAIVRRAGLDEPRELQLFDMLQRKAVPEIEVFLAEAGLDDACRQALTELPMLTGGREILQQARQVLAFAGDEMTAHLDDLEQIADALAQYAPEVVLNFDLAEMRGYHYETGLVFAAYLPGEGEEIARGGRYDGIGRDFGRSRLAIGFSTDLKILMRIGNAVFTSQTKTIFSPAQADPQVVKNLRKEGHIVISGLDDGDASTVSTECTHVLVFDQNQWKVVER